MRCEQVDGSLDLDASLALLEEHFGPLLPEALTSSGRRYSAVGVVGCDVGVPIQIVWMFTNSLMPYEDSSRP